MIIIYVLGLWTIFGAVGGFLYVFGRDVESFSVTEQAGLTLLGGPILWFTFFYNLFKKS